MQVKTCGFPPLEDRDKSLGLFSGIDYFGGGKLTKEETVSFLCLHWSLILVHPSLLNMAKNFCENVLNISNSWDLQSWKQGQWMTCLSYSQTFGWTMRRYACHCLSMLLLITNFMPSGILLPNFKFQLFLRRLWESYRRSLMVMRMWRWFLLYSFSWEIFVPIHVTFLLILSPKSGECFDMINLVILLVQIRGNRNM